MYMYVRRGFGVNALEGGRERERERGGEGRGGERESGGPLRAAFPITRSN